MQDLFKKDGIKFGPTFKTVKDTSWTCTDGTVKHHYFNTMSTNQLNAVAQTNGAGKLNGWILDGGISVYGPTTGYTTGDEEPVASRRTPAPVTAPRSSPP